MPMTQASLLTRLKAALGIAETPEGQAIQDEVLGKIAGAIIEEIQTNGVVTVTVSGTATGVTVGGAAVPVAGTGTGTIA